MDCKVTGYEFLVELVLGANGESKEDAQKGLEEDLKKALEENFPILKMKVSDLKEEIK